jgi:hypothetical protein
MPSYKVLEKGFMFGRLYDPKGKRPVLHSDMPLKPVPHWLEPIAEVVETAAEKKARLAAEKKAADKRKSDKVEVDAVNFMTDKTAVAATQPGSVVTTL